MCFTWAISIWRREKYFARMRMRMSLIGSTGCTLNRPKSNQLCAPFTTLPALKRRSKREAPPRKRTNNTSLLRKNRQSMKLPAKNATKDMSIHTSCFEKNVLPEELSVQGAASSLTAVGASQGMLPRSDEKIFTTPPPTGGG